MSNKSKKIKGKPVKKDNVTRNITIGTFLFVILSFIFFYNYAQNQKNNVATPKTAISDAATGKALIFNEDVKNVPVLDIWEDLQCPVCKQFEANTGSTLSRLIEEKKVVARFHIVSFLGAESVSLANTAFCAADEGKFRDIHDYFYKNQPKENSGFWSDENLINAGSSVGIKSESFKNCVTRKKYLDYVNYTMNFMAKSKVQATPTIFVNGKEINREKYNYFEPASFLKAIGIKE